ncbi:hypothetical protein ABC1282 [Shouchella clausii KSM-K16]|uniref:Uncharacterized protein n=1 Tax=Shouchella clausii (strain KSM-K16) TaxID=66692 RepID=Q5WII5_SHOC1|nr:hypothetical protein ABC1282 [Shouchella clausii KSM-K16]
MAVPSEVPLGTSLVKCPYRAKLKPPVLPADTYCDDNLISVLRLSNHLCMRLILILLINSFKTHHIICPNRIKWFLK